MSETRRKPKAKRQVRAMTLEALHTTYVLMDTFDRHVLQSRTAKKFKDVAKQADVAHQALFDLYQLLGQRFP